MVLPLSLESQNNQTNPDTYNWFDEIVGTTNSGIFEGTQYFERYKRIKERHQFFKTYTFSTGSVVYNDQSYFDILVKYDVFDEKLLVQDLNTLNAPVVELDKNKISEFEIGNHKFIHLNRDQKSKNEVSGYFEILLKKETFGLYKKHLKEIIRKSDEKVDYLDKQVASYQFKDKQMHFVHYNETYYKVKKANDLNAIFLNLKTEIKSFSKKYKTLRKSDPDGYIMSILEDLNAVMSANNQSVQ